MKSVIAKLTEIFDVRPKILRDRQITVEVDKNRVSSMLLYLKNQMGFIHLNHISCVDWIEEGQFELVYIVWRPEDKTTVLVKTRIDRENPEMENIDTIWDQAHTYEREIREMFGIEFPGLKAPREFILEGWEGPPPMRRDFDTRKYAMETYETRPGREDAQNVREYITKRTGEKVPDFAKKYSRD
jgi:NADH-quinone oxidoreductase subunit C